MIIVEAIKAKDLKPASNLKQVLIDIENYMLAHQGIDPFDEIMKLFITKLYDEKINLSIFPGSPLRKPDKYVEFKAASDEHNTFVKINELFQKAKKKWPSIFTSESEIIAKPHVLFFCVKKLQYLSLTSSGLDVLGEAFESLINPRIKGEKGQYFTPPQVVRMAVTMLNPTINDKILDPACGSGSFLIETINKIVKENSLNDKEMEIAEYVKEKVYGIDFDTRLTKIAKAYMILYGSDENNIHFLDTLDIESWSQDDKKEISNFDIIITNPPFAGTIRDNKILKNYYLAKNIGRKKGFSRKITREILFLERCIQLLKNGGRLGIVLPHGITSNQSLQYVREFLFSQGEIQAIVSFDDNMFRPYTSANTCFIVFKKTNGMKKRNYPIFFAISEKSGKNSKGDYIFTNKTKSSEAKIMLNGKEHFIDTDTYEIALAYRRIMNE